MASFADALRALESLKAERVVEEYAVAGAMAILFWTEPVPTYDLDVLVFLPPAGGPIVSLDPICRWAAQRGYPAQAEHIVVEGVPTQFVPSPGRLADEAITEAQVLEYEDVRVRVVRPEHLIALYLEPSARTARREARAAMLLELPGLNRERLDAILLEHGLTL